MIAKRKKAQAAITDLFIAIGMFIILITITSALWNLYNTRLANKTTYNDLVVKSFQVSDVLFKTEGYPQNWDHLIREADAGGGVTQADIDMISYIGLVEGERHVPIDKYVALGLLDGNNVSEMFNARRYQLTIRLIDFAGNEIQSIGSTQIVSTGRFAVNLARTVLIENQTSPGSYFPGTAEVQLSA